MNELQVSPIDSDLVDMFNWHKGEFYIERTTSYKKEGKKTTVRLHRMVMERVFGRPLERTEEVDHKDRNKLNNCRENLRIVSKSQNMHNRPKPISNTSGYKGVRFKPNRNKSWEARIYVNGLCKHLGHYSTPSEASIAYIKAGGLI